jgi:death on curing protein
MKEPLWLSREVALATHAMMMAQHGGLEGVRDEGLLESALTKPKNKFAYGSASLSELAASYAADIIHNHPLLDGNKRTGFVLAATFLEINGFEFFADEPHTIERTLALAASAISEDEYAGWLADNSQVRKLQK